MAGEGAGYVADVEVFCPRYALCARCGVQNLGGVGEQTNSSRGYVGFMPSTAPRV